MANDAQELSPGWYPDRITAGMNRWWDGTQWTAHTQPAATAPAAAAATPAASAAPAAAAPVDATAESAVPVDAGAVPVAPPAPASPYDAPAPVPGYVRPPARNGIAYTSFVFGILAMILAIVDLAPVGNTFFFGVWGIVAIITGVRAILRRRFGQVSVLWPQVTGIVLGSLATLVFLGGLILTGIADAAGY